MKTKRIVIAILCLFMCVVMGGEVLLSALSIPTSAAEEISYTNAYNDLRSDRTFDPDKYPAKADDYSLELITIAESSDKELFVYVYQPSGQMADVRAVSINISTEERTNKSFKNYKLEYLNSYGVFFKYKVKDLTVSSDAERYYEISSIYRPWSESYGDKKPGGDNTISEEAFAVGKLFTLSGTSTKVEDIEYIEVTEKYVGYIRYEQDTIYPDYVEDRATDSHFVAFSTNRRIDELLEADVYYEYQIYNAWHQGVLGNIGDPWSDVGSGYSYLDYTQKAMISVSDGDFFVHKVEAEKRIERTLDFLSQDVTFFQFPGFSLDSNVEFTEESLLELAKTQWVLRFIESDYLWWTDTNPLSGTNGDYIHRYARVGNVSILRLKFKTDGVVYNLGVVDNKQTGSEDPAAVVEEQEWWQKIMMMLTLILLIALLSFFSGPIGVVAKIIWNGIKVVLKIVFWISSSPYRLLRWIFKTISRKKKGRVYEKKN